MQPILLAILIAILLVVVYQDFKSRAISWFLIPLLLMVVLTNAVMTINIEELTIFLGINLLLVLVNMLGVTLIISVKEKRIKNIINSYLGLGDVLFFIVLTTLFSPINFVVFFIGSIFLITLIYGGVMLFRKQQNTLIPLAGAMSLVLIAVLLVQQFTTSFHLYQDLFIINE